MKNVIIDLGERSYPIYIGSFILSTIPGICTTHHIPRHLAIITDRNVARLYLKKTTTALKRGHYEILPLIVPAGEKQKSLVRANRLITRMLEEKFPRGGAIIALGGGMVGDLAGFVASVYRRGIRLIQVPTTLLAQMESSSGGKTAVNHPLMKNAIGAFHQPVFVLADIGLLATLPRREVVCGLGEIVKYGLYAKEMFDYLDQNIEKLMELDPAVTEETIYRCNLLKADMISKDERETDPTGGRLVLNLGHTIGQAIESLLHYKLRHGEAVLVGLGIEAAIAREAGILNVRDYEKMMALFVRVGFRPKVKFPPVDVIVKAITDQNGKVRFIFPKRIGEIVVCHDIEPALVKRVLRKLPESFPAPANGGLSGS